MHYLAIRSTLYAYISAIEEDLRDIIAEQIWPTFNELAFLSDERIAELMSLGVSQDDIYGVLFNLDFAEPWQIISSNRSLVDPDVSDAISRHIAKIPEYVGIRNAVMHSRPIEANYLSSIVELVDDLKKTSQSSFRELRKTARSLSIDPSAALEKDVPIDRSGDRISHNLPTPDFDESGLVGRNADLDELHELVKGPWPIISIIGEGAIGKTALAVRLAYQILDDEAYDFDTIIWVSAKANKLLPTEIQDLNNEIKSSIDLLASVGDQLGAAVSTESGFDELLEYLNTFKILLIIDNLETVIDENLKSFLGRFSSRDSKILITSRIGIGDFERRFALSHLDERDAVTLLRALSKVRKVEHLTRCSNSQLLSYCKKLLNSLVSLSGMYR